LDNDIPYDDWIQGLQNPTHTDCDLDVDGDVDVHDLDLMFAQYGLEFNLVS
jgi:hypothetical protein